MPKHFACFVLRIRTSYTSYAWQHSCQFPVLDVYQMQRYRHLVTGWPIVNNWAFRSVYLDLRLIGKCDRIFFSFADSDFNEPGTICRVIWPGTPIHQWVRWKKNLIMGQKNSMNLLISPLFSSRMKSLPSRPTRTLCPCRVSLQRWPNMSKA